MARVAAPAAPGAIDGPSAAEPGAPWPNGLIRYFNEAQEHQWAVAKAASAWNASGAQVQFVPVARDEAELIITARDDEPCGNGRATVGYTPEATVSVFKVGACGRFTAARTIADELGHVLGLSHNDRTGALMNSSGDYRGSRQCRNSWPWTWRCRLIEEDDALRAVMLYGGAADPPRSPATCPLYQAIAPLHGLRLVRAQSTHTHLALAFRRPPDVALPPFIGGGREPSFAVAYRRSSCANNAGRPRHTRYRWSVRRAGADRSPTDPRPRGSLLPRLGSRPPGTSQQRDVGPRNRSQALGTARGHRCSDAA